MPPFQFLYKKPGGLNAGHVTFAFGLAAISLGQALQSGNGFLNSSSLLYLTLSLAFLLWGVFGAPAFKQPFLSWVSRPLFVLALILQIYQLAFTYLGDNQILALDPALWQFRLLVLLAGILALGSLAPTHWVLPTLQKYLTMSVLIVVWLAGVWVIRHIPNPFIDVFVFEQNSSRAILEGVNPYSLTTPNIYGDLGVYAYGARLIENGVLNFGNPYPPLSIYVSLLGYLFGGDIRYSHLLAYVLSGALIAFFRPESGSRLAAYILLFTPKAMYVIEQSWTEPIVLLMLTAVIYSAIHNKRWMPIMVGLLFASKQYLLFVFPLTLLIFPLQQPYIQWFRRYSGIVFTALLVTAPLALWDLRAFMWNVGELIWYLPFRLDSLSYLSAYARVFDTQPSYLIAFMMLALAFVLVWRFLPRETEGFAAAFAFCLMVFFAFNRQAFCNYYFLVIGAICCTWSVMQPENTPENLSKLSLAKNKVV